MRRLGVSLAVAALIGGVFSATTAPESAQAATCSSSCFNVSAYGADSTGAASSSGAIQAAIDAAEAATAADPNITASVVLGSGTYRLTDSLQVTEASRVRIIGTSAASTKLRFEPVHGHVFDVRRSDRVSIEGLSLDRPNATLPWTQLTVTGVGGYSTTDPYGYVDVSVDSGYPLPSASIFDDAGDSTLGFPQDANGNFGFGYFSRGNSADVNDPKKWRYEIAPGVWRIHFYNVSWNKFFVGQRIALITAVEQDIALAFRTNKNITIRDVGNYASGFMGLWSDGMDTLTIDDYVSVPSPGRLMSSTRDAIHLTGWNRGPLTLTDSVFKGSGDDILNYTMIDPGGLEVVNSSTIRVRNGVARVGETVEIYSASTRQRLARTTVAAVTQATSFSTVQLQAAVPGMTTGDLFFNEDASFKNSTISRNTFLNHRGRGLLPHGVGVDITDNTFRDVPQATLIRSVATGVGEGPVTRDVLFSGNTVENVLSGPALDIGGEPVASASRESAVGYEISDNNFVNLSKPMLSAELGEDIQVINNDVSVSPSAAEGFDLIEVGGAIRNVANMDVIDLDVTAPGNSPLRAVVDIRQPGNGLGISSITGTHSAAQFSNPEGTSFSFNGGVTSKRLGPGSTSTNRIWDFTAGNEGWTNGLNVGATASGGRLNYLTSGPDASILSPSNLGLSASKHRYLKFQLSNGTAGDYAQVYFTTTSDPVWNGAKYALVAVTPQDTVGKEYVVDMGAIPAWSGTISQIRIDLPDQSAGGGSGSLDYIHVSNSPWRNFAPQRWDFETGLGGLSLFNISSHSVSSGNFNYTSSSNPIVITQPLGIPTNSVRYIEIVMKNTAPGDMVRVFYTTAADPAASESKRLDLKVIPSDSQYRTYQVDTSGLNWKGTLNDLRFDLPQSNGTSSSSSIASISLVGDTGVVGSR